MENLTFLITITMAINFITSNNQALWYETFGNPSKETILLIQGSGAQGILWPYDFCKQLEQAGYFVIRYDHRDTGRSSIVNYDITPYNLMDLTKDAKGILDGLNIKKAHIIGSSMGGYIAQLLGIYYPESVRTLTLMMTSTISASLEHAFLEEAENPFSLPLPTKEFADALLNSSCLINSKESMAKHFLSLWSAYNGNAKSFDQITWYKLALLWQERSKIGTHNINHRLAINASPLTRTKELQYITTPVLVIHGKVDPFFTLEHAYALQKAIPGTILKLIDNMGHLFHEFFIEEVSQSILTHLHRSKTPSTRHAAP